MNAQQARELTDNTIAMEMITQAAMMKKTEVKIPKQHVNREYLVSQGYKVSGNHQMISELTVSWGRDNTQWGQR